MKYLQSINNGIIYSMEENNFIFKKFLTPQMYNHILDYCDNYSKIIPFQTDMNILYKKNLPFVSHIHYQINSFLQGVVEKEIKPSNNYLLSPHKQISSLDTHTLIKNDYYFYYIANSTTNSVQVEGKYFINCNEGYLSNSKETIKICKEDSRLSILLFLFDCD
jgi:hypothetical protein